jgi:hypothetical protein
MLDFKPASLNSTAAVSFLKAAPMVAAATTMKPAAINYKPASMSPARAAPATTQQEAAICNQFNQFHN